jgi:1,2-phenylacetyl-CoA epoxidase catalytic subunit
MEGASWIVQKAFKESEHHLNQMTELVEEFVKRSKQCLKSEVLNEYDGKMVVQVREWLFKELTI